MTERLLNFPPPPAGGAALSLLEFLIAAEEQANEAPLRVMLAQGNYFLDDSLHLRRTCLDLIIEGEGDVSISGSGHCLFHIRGRKTALRLVNLSLIHTQFRSDKREIGACVFALHQATVRIENCTLVSSHGFALWVVQKAQVEVVGCTLTATKRSACVCFGDCTVSFDGTKLSESGKHGICCRGRVVLRASDCEFSGNSVRALYGYQSVDIQLHRCVFRGTKSEAHSAIEVLGGGATGLRQRKKLVLRMQDCSVHSNSGGGLLIHGDKESIEFSVTGTENSSGETFLLQAADAARPQGPDELGEVWCWEYNADDPSTEATKGWVRYDSDSSAKIEEAFVKGHPQILALAGGLYVLNLELMEQENSQSFYTRSIRRAVGRS